MYYVVSDDKILIIINTLCPVCLVKFFQNDYDPGYCTVLCSCMETCYLTVEVDMDIRTDIIVYIWLLPLLLFVVIPLCMLAVYSVWRFIYFMLFPRRMREQKVEKKIPERDLEKAL